MLDSKLSEVGYDTNNAVLNLGTIFVLILIVLILFGFMGLINLCKCKSKKSVTVYEFLRKKLVYSLLISILIETYMELLICGYLNLSI